MKTQELELLSWGVDTDGQLGLPEPGQTYPIPRHLNLRMSVVSVACGEDHSLLLNSQGQVLSLGSNVDGRLGIGDKQVRYKTTPSTVKGLEGFKVVQISAGWGHSCALTEDGRVYSWGLGANGALGNGSTEAEWRPCQMQVPGKVLQVDCGARHTGIILSPDELYMCGSGDVGQLGTGRRTQVLTPVKIRIESNVTAVACGIFHTLVLIKTGRVLAMGGNSFGQLGTGNKLSSLVPVEVKGLRGITQVDCCHFSAAVSDRGELHVWGTGVFGEFLIPRTVTKIPSAVRRVRVGSCFAAAVDVQGTLWTWGNNSSGELGLGNYEPRANPSSVDSLGGSRVVDFDCGSAFILAIVSTNRLHKPDFESSALRLSQLSPRHDIRSSSRSLRDSSRLEVKHEPIRPTYTRDNEDIEDDLIIEHKRRQDLEALAEDLQLQLARWEMEIRPLEDENDELRRLTEDQQIRLREAEGIIADKDAQVERLLERLKDLETLLERRNEAEETEREAVLEMQHELRLRARDYRDRTLSRLKASPNSMQTDTTSVGSHLPRPSSPRVALSPKHLSRLAKAAEERTLQSVSPRLRQSDRLQAKHEALNEVNTRLDFKAKLSAIQQNRQNLKSRLSEIEESMRRRRKIFHYEID